jgi:hypothetical protein
MAAMIQKSSCPQKPQMVSKALTADSPDQRCRKAEPFHIIILQGGPIQRGWIKIISLGCNEVPKAFGGTYWDDDSPNGHRDFEEGIDANQLYKTVIDREVRET